MVGRVVIGLDAMTPGFEHAGRPDVLYVVHRLPYPPDKGDRIRAYHILRFLSQRASVHLACLADEPPAEGAVAALERLCERVAVVRTGRWSRMAGAAWSLGCGRTATEGAFGSSTLRATLRTWARETRFQAALASSSGVAPYLRMEELRGVPAVVDVVDVDSEKWFEYAEGTRGPTSWVYQTEGRRLRRLESELPDWAAAVTLVSDAEADLFRTFRDAASVHSVTNGVDLDYYRPTRAPERCRCVFVGALDYLPNIDAVQWFCRDVWPAVLRRHPQASLALVGRRPASAVRRLSDVPGVEVIGQVDDVRPHVAEAAVAVAPLRIARGVQNKVLEALAMGKAVVTSPQALAGLSVQPGLHVRVAASADAWVESVSALLNDADLRARLGREGRRHVEFHYEWPRCLGPFAELLGVPSRAEDSPPGSVSRSHQFVADEG
jgi:sugar transferase (PEP-CTERM/EpsH1 system associated)